MDEAAMHTPTQVLAYALSSRYLLEAGSHYVAFTGQGLGVQTRLAFSLQGFTCQLLCVFLRQGLSVWPRLAENSLHSLGWSRTRGPPPTLSRYWDYKLELAHLPIDSLFFDYKSWNKIPKPHARHVLNFESR